MDYIISIPGPVFLLVYSIYSVVIISIAKAISLNDYTAKMEIPETTEFEPFELAYLKNGIKGIIITSIFNLWKQKLIDIKKKKSYISMSTATKVKPNLNAIESFLFNFLYTESYYRNLFTQNSLNSIEELFVINKNKLKEHKLLVDETIKSRNKRILFNTIILLVAFSGIKIYFGIIRHKPVMFLILLLILFLFLAWQILNPEKIKVSSLGRKLLKQSKQRFKWLKESNNRNHILSENHILFGIAIFGVSPFFKTELGRILDSPKVMEQTGWLANGTGAGASSDSGCTGCSGGCSGCSGGCGGCGGD